MDAGPMLGCLTGLLTMAATVRGAWASVHVDRWERVAGSVSGVHVSETHGGDRVAYQGYLTYRYAFRGLRTGTLQCCPSTQSKRQAQAAIAPYSRGQALDVYVYVLDPNRSKLSAAFDPAYVGIFCTGLFFLLAFLAVGLSLD